MGDRQSRQQIIRRMTRHARNRCVVLLVSALILTCATTPAAAQETRSYVYSFHKEPLPSPAPFVARSLMRGEALVPGGLRRPEDLNVGADGKIYIADTGNDRVLRFGPSWELELSVESFTNDGVPDSFDAPAGVFADEDGVIYVADTQNRRIVILNPDGSPRLIIPEPREEIIREEYQYLPTRITVDQADRIYVVGPGMFEGMMEFDSDGSFQGFLGSNRVQFNFIDYIWKQLSTREQRETQALFIPEEFNNLDIDRLGFIYTVTSQEEADEPIKRHNAEGLDVLRREGFFDPQGDVVYPEIGPRPGPSLLVDVAVEPNGTYSVLDAKRGRIFTYDEEGHLLFAFGGLANQLGTFRDPVALDYQDGDLLVLDRTLGAITLFEATEFGRYVREAVYRYNQGDYDMAFALWKRVLQLNANYELGYTGLGKILYRRGAYHDALEYFLLGNNRRYYSRSYEQVRQDFLREHFGLLMPAVIILVGALLAWRRVRERNAAFEPMKLIPANPPLWMRVQYSLHLIRHPFDGFYDLKHAGIGTTGSAAVLVGLFVFAMLVHTQLTAFLFNLRDVSELSMSREVITILLPFVIFAVANWTLTTLMDGEGTIRNIFIATAYATVPMILIYLPLTGISHVLTEQEEALFYFFRTFAAVWVGWLLFTGNMITHGYSVRKTIATLLLTVVAMGIIIFLALLFFTFIEQVWSFLRTIYQEVVFRI